jgi:hypothetical protein
MSTEVKGLKDFQKKNGAREETKKPDVKRNTFTIEQLMKNLAMNAADKLYDKIARGGR